MRTNSSLLNGLMCLFNVHKIIFQESRLFFLSLCISKIKYTTYGKGLRIQSMTKSTAEIISTRGCFSKKVKWKRNWLLIYFCSILVSPSQLGEEELYLCVLEGCLAELLYKINSVSQSLSPSMQLPPGPGTMETCFSLQSLWRKHQTNPLLCKLGTRGEKLILSHLISRDVNSCLPRMWTIFA
jgi:hypothetical protein